jgi:hypothetical protein
VGRLLHIRDRTKVKSAVAGALRSGFGAAGRRGLGKWVVVCRHDVDIVSGARWREVGGDGPRAQA